jgi:hypothetical protein
LAEIEAEKVGYQRKVVEAFENKRKQLESELASRAGRKPHNGEKTFPTLGVGQSPQGTVAQSATPVTEDTKSIVRPTKPPSTTSGFLGLGDTPPQAESRKLKPAEVVGLIVGIAIPVVGFILSAPGAAGVTGVFEARELLAAAWFITVVGAFLI